MKILLTNVSRGEQPHIYFPLGLGYIAAPLLKKGHEISFLDVQDLTHDEIEKKLTELDFDLVGISALITDFKYVQWFSSCVRSRFPELPIVLGGGLTTVAELILGRSEVDIAVLQDGEVTMCELVGALAEKRSLKEVAGITYKESGKFITTAHRKPPEDLDSIDFPAYDVFEMDRFLQTEKLGFSYPTKSLSVLTTRGCPYSCVYCDKGVWGAKYRARSAADIIKEIKYLKAKFSIEAVVFSDDLFVLDKKRVYEFCDLMISENIDIAWSCNGRVNIMDQELLEKMKQAGCMNIAYGLESGSQRMLDAMNKSTTVEQGKQAVMLTRKVGIDIHPYLVLGMVGEDEESIRETVEFCKDLGLPVGKFGIFTPLPNTRLYEMAEEMGLMPPIDTQIENWQDWTENITVNLSALSDERLLELKAQAEQEIRNYYVWHHKRVILKRLMLRYREGGVVMAAATLVNWVRKFLKYQIRPAK